MTSSSALQWPVTVSCQLLKELPKIVFIFVGNGGFGTVLLNGTSKNMAFVVRSVYFIWTSCL